MTGPTDKSVADGIDVMHMARPMLDRLADVFAREGLPVGETTIALLAMSARVMTESAAMDRETFLRTCAALWDANAAAAAHLTSH